jgi:hypothetical protein
MDYEELASMKGKFKKWLVNNFTNINQTKTWVKNRPSQKYITG